MQRTNGLVDWIARVAIAGVVVGGLVLGGMAACDLERKDRTESGSAGTSTEVASVERPRSGGARLVSDTRPISVATGVGGETASPDSSGEESAEAPIPENVTYGDAEAVFRSGEYEAAADLFEAYTVRRPENPWGYYMLGISAWRAGDHPRAESALRRTLEVDSTHEKGMINLARVLLEQRKASDALDYAERVVERKPDSGEGWRVLGNAYSDLGMVEEAVEAYREALVLNHRDSWTMNNLGLLMIREGRYEEALPSLARATELRPDVATFQNNLGIALERSGHPVEAVEAYRAALAADPAYGKAQVSLERVESRAPTPAVTAIDLGELASGFAEQLNRWKSERLEAERAARVEPGVGLETIPEPEVTVKPEPELKPDTLSQSEPGAGRAAAPTQGATVPSGAGHDR